MFAKLPNSRELYEFTLSAVYESAWLTVCELIYKEHPVIF